VTISGNSAGAGGGIYCDVSIANLNHVIMIGNTADDGGGICCYSSSQTLTNVTVSGNTADRGGGIYCSDFSQSILRNCIFWNDAPQEVYFDSYNDFFWNDAPQEVYFDSYNDSNTIFISYSDIQGDSAGIVTNDNGTIHWFDGNIDCDPRFCYPDTGNYFLGENSCCVGAGEGGGDIGAFGIGCGHVYICGDCNGDERINFADALYLKNYYYQTPPGSPPPVGSGDVNLDGNVTFADALYIKNYYYQTPSGSPPPCEPPKTDPFRERRMER
jgi:predicted outer membrane repeat protein